MLNVAIDELATSFLPSDINGSDNIYQEHQTQDTVNHHRAQSVTNLKKRLIYFHLGKVSEIKKKKVWNFPYFFYPPPPGG